MQIEHTIKRKEHVQIYCELIEEIQGFGGRTKLKMAGATDIEQGPHDL